MRIISSAWVATSVAEFEAACCLHTHAKLNLASAHTPFEIFVLDGFAQLPESLIASMLERSVILHDATKAARAATDRFRKLFSFFAPGQGAMYEVYCFIRWIVLRELLAGEPFLHVDLDLFFQHPLNLIESLFAGMTGTFNGSPCLTSVADAEWLRTYSEALESLTDDRPGLEASIGYTGNEFRKHISSDQDLVAALEARQILPSGGLGAVHDSFHVFINPLWPYQHKPLSPMRFENASGLDSMDGKPVLFWHLQNNAADYLSRYMTVTNFKQTWLNAFLPVKLGLPFIQLAPSAENFAFQALRDVAWSQIRDALASSVDIETLGALKFFSRTWISEWFLVQKQGRELFTGAYWWEESVFQ